MLPLQSGRSDRQVTSVRLKLTWAEIKFTIPKWNCQSNINLVECGHRYIISEKILLSSCHMRICLIKYIPLFSIFIYIFANNRKLSWSNFPTWYKIQYLPLNLNFEISHRGLEVCLSQLWKDSHNPHFVQDLTFSK